MKKPIGSIKNIAKQITVIVPAILRSYNLGTHISLKHIRSSGFSLLCFSIYLSTTMLLITFTADSLQRLLSELET